MEWHIGCSGFSYKEWKDVFYPKGTASKDWFSYYCSKFSTIELNVTFYRFPQLAILQKWYEKSPPGFLFAVKAPRLMTHLKQLKDCEGLMIDFYTTVRAGLQEKLGPLLFQFPPAFIYSAERMNRIITLLDKNFINAVEFRHPSWWKEEVYMQLKAAGIIFCPISYPGLPHDIIITGSQVYYRFHGIPRLYYSKYDIETLRQFADTINARKDLSAVWCYFNNTAAVSATENALWLEDYTDTLNS